jgi:hypothetical protein
MGSRTRLGVVLLILLAPAWTSCGSDTPTPTPTGPATVVPPTVTRVSITGNVTLTQIGETTQLTAIATLSDNTTKNITSEGQWRAGDARVVSISPGGLVTVIGFGATWITFNSGNRGDSRLVSATPSGTSVVAGRVREPGRGPLASVRVEDTLSGRSTTSGPEGEVSLAELSSPQAHLKVEKERYETVEVDATGTNVDLPMQEMIRLTAGETTFPAPLAPNDLKYVAGGRTCFDCRLIRVIVPQAGTVHIRVTWTVAVVQLSLFAEGQVVKGGTRELTADVPISAPREVLMYLGAESSNVVTTHTSFIFETSLR